MNKLRELTRDENLQLKNGTINGLTMAIDEIMHVIANTENNEAVYALDIVCVSLKAERLKYTTELKRMLENNT